MRNFGWFLLAALVSAPAIHAQDHPINDPQTNRGQVGVPQIHGLASRMATSISASNQQSVIVFDFVGPDQKATVLGQMLADEFSEVLAQSGGKFIVENRATIITALMDKHYALQTLSDPRTAFAMARDLGARVAVFGKLSVEDATLVVSVEAYRVKNFKWIVGLKVPVPLTNNVQALLDQDADENLLSNYPRAGENGYSTPACRYCPSPKFTDEAVADHLGGTVELLLVIGANGRPQDLRVLRGLPDGLTDSAIQTVRSWRFRPANGPDGQPATVVTPVEMTFAFGATP